MMVNGIPKTEKIWVKITTDDGNIFYTTSKVNDRVFYYLYKFVDGKAIKLGKAKSPIELDEKYIKNKG